VLEVVVTVEVDSVEVVTVDELVQVTTSPSPPLWQLLANGTDAFEVLKPMATEAIMKTNTKPARTRALLVVLDLWVA